MFIIKSMQFINLHFWTYLVNYNISWAWLSNILMASGPLTVFGFVVKEKYKKSTPCHVYTLILLSCYK